MSTATGNQIRLDQQLIGTSRSMLSAANQIAIVSHRHPDADTIGSNLCLRRVLEKQGKTVKSLCIDAPPHYCRFLAGTDLFQNSIEIARYDLIVTVDCGSRQQAGFAELSAGELPCPLLNLDHHASNDHYGDLTIVLPQASSTAQIIFMLLEGWNESIEPSMATALLAGLYFDTGSFMHSNVSAELLEIAASLTALGANLPAIHANLFRNFSEEKFHLWGQTLENVRLNRQGNAIAVINTAMVEDNFLQENLSGLIDYVSMLKDSPFALLVNETPDGQLHGSLRTRSEEINLTELAARLGGGGHRKASGFGFPARLKKELFWSVTN